jgi:hypothetical protein
VNKADLPYQMLDDPNPFDTPDNLERHLAEVQARPDYVNKDSDIKHLRDLIEMSRRYSRAKTAG